MSDPSKLEEVPDMIGIDLKTLDANIIQARGTATTSINILLQEMVNSEFAVKYGRDEADKVQRETFDMVMSLAQCLRQELETATTSTAPLVAIRYFLIMVITSTPTLGGQLALRAILADSAKDQYTFQQAIAWQEFSRVMAGIIKDADESGKP